MLSPPGSAEEEHAVSGLPVAAKKAAERYSEGGQHQRIRSPACFTVPDLRNTQVRREGHWPRAGRKFALVRTGPSRRSTANVLVARRSLSCRRPAQGSRCAGGDEETADGAHWRKKRHKPRARICPTAPRRQLAKADSCRGETCRSNRTAGTRNGWQRPVLASQTETGSRSS